MTTLNYLHEDADKGVMLDLRLSVEIDPGQRLIINADPDRCQEGWPAHVEEISVEVVGYTLDTPDGVVRLSKANGTLPAEFAASLAANFEREMEDDKDLRYIVNEYCMESVGGGGRNYDGPDY